MIKNFIPSSLFVRFILIIILPTIFAQVIATYVFYNRHWHSVSRNMARSLANDIQVIYDLKKQNIDYDEINRIASQLSIKTKTSSYKHNQKPIDYFSSETEFLHEFLKKSFSYPISIKFIEDDDAINIDIFHERYILSFITNSKRINNSSTYIFILWMTGTSIIFLFLSIIFTKNQIRPIIKLARAADRFGKGQHNLYLKPEGAKEVRKASMAFLKMKERIERQINYRVEMLAGVSHDLRTPLTRMKLQLALSKDQELLQMLDDVKDMEYMINSYINFAQSDVKEETKLVIFNKFIGKILSLYKNKNYVIQNIPNLKIALRTNAIKRCFQNLLDNAFKYGNKVIINSYIASGELYIEIHDDGPGVPIEKREDVFKPFFRIDESRNRDTGGVGLGLAITRDIINNHGGQIYLDSSELIQGLKVIIILPL